MTKEKLFTNLFQWGSLVALVAVAMPELAFADGQDLNQLLNSFQRTELPAIPAIISAVSYVGGAVLGISGALKLKAHAENPAAEKMAPGIARLVTGGALVAAPSILAMLQNSTQLNNNVARFQSWSVTF